MTTRELIALLESEFEFIAQRSRGPGGQNVNKVSSAAMLFWDFNKSRQLSEEKKQLITAKLPSFINKDGSIFLRSDEYRDLQQNKKRCMEKLEGLLMRAFHRDKPRKASKPTRSSKLKKKETKSRHSKIKKSRGKLNFDF